MATELLTFHNDPQLKAQLIARIGVHEDADAIARGAYEKWNGHVQRCAVGCSVRDLSDRGDEPKDWHREMETLLGIPRWLCLLEDCVFEGMADNDAMGWPRRFAQTVPIGVSLDGLADKLAVRRLREECLPLSGTWPESVRAQVVAAIEQTIAALEPRRSAASAAWSAESAAWSAESAAWSAAASAESAAWSAWSAESAAWSAESAAASAESAAWSARSAAASAVYKRESDRIVEILHTYGTAN